MSLNHTKNPPWLCSGKKVQTCIKTISDTFNNILISLNVVCYSQWYILYAGPQSGSLVGHLSGGKEVGSGGQRWVTNEAEVSTYFLSN